MAAANEKLLDDLFGPVSDRQLEEEQKVIDRFKVLLELDILEQTDDSQDQGAQ